jgi:D-inositol-3-phosphate glycosyltransferase
MNVYVRAVCTELSRRGIQTEVFTRRSTRGGPDRLQLAEHSWVTRLQAGSAGEVDKTQLFDLVPAFTLSLLLEVSARGLDFSLLHSHYWLSGWVAARLRDEWRLPWFHTAHTLARVKNEHAAPGAVLEPEHRIAVEQAIVRQCDRLVASSPAEAEDLVRLYGADRRRVSLVAPGVDLSTFKPRPAASLRRRLGLEGRRVIVFAGRLERLKGAEILLRAFAILSRSREELGRLSLLLIGDDSHNGARESRAQGGERARLCEVARQLGILAQVRFMGALSQPALARYLSLADVCVVPSASESFGLVALEAQACGTPVVSARVGGLPSIVKDGLTGYTLDSRDPGAYAERIGRLLQDEELRRCFSRRSRLVASQFTWEATVERLLREYAGPVRVLEPAAVG